MMKPEKLPYEDYKYVFSKVPRLCVDMIVKGENGILLIERAIDPGKGLWHFPGGGVLRGESLEAAMKRIALDELNVEIGEQRLIGMMEFNNPNSKFFHTVSAVYEVKPKTSTFTGGEQGKNIDYFRELPGKMIEEQRLFALDYLGVTSR